MKNHHKGMAQHLIIIIVVFATLVIGGGVYFYSSRSNTEVLGNETESYFSDKVSDMFERGVPLECSSEINNAEGSVKAVYYFDNQNEQVRVEMEVFDTSSGTTINTVSIIKDEWNYFWDNLANEDGMKVKFDEEEDSILPSDDSTLEDSEMEFDFVCKDWKVDPRKFDLPADKSFKDLSNMMNGFDSMLDAPADSNSGSEPDYGASLDNLCDVCNFLPDGPEKTECLNSCQ
jgi:hypothetical protein